MRLNSNLQALKYLLALIMKNWIPTLSLSLMAFIFVTTEFLPVGLLPDIAASFNRNIPSTGLLMTVYAWIVATMSLPFTIFTSRFNRRNLVISLLVLFIIAHLIAGFSTSFYQLVFARVLIAFSHSIFWSIATPLAIRLAPEGKKNMALAIIVTGASLGNVLGIPVGTLLGHALGWKNSFLAIAILSSFIFLIILKTLPNAQTTMVAKFKDVPILLKNKTISTFYILIAVVITGHFTLFTYISPLIQTGPNNVALLLLAFGLSGIAGGYIAGKLLDKKESSLIYLGLLFILCGLILAPLIINFQFLSYINIIIWGLGFTIAPFIFQAKIITEAREASDIAVSMYSGIFNIGIGGGALIGSLATPIIGLGNLGILGAIFLFFAIIYYRLKT